MPKKISTIEDLGDIIQGIDSKLSVHVEETRENFKSIGDHLVSIENRLEELSEIAKLRNKIDRIQQNIREKLHVEV